MNIANNIVFGSQLFNAPFPNTSNTFFDPVVDEFNSLYKAAAQANKDEESHYVSLGLAKYENGEYWREDYDVARSRYVGNITPLPISSLNIGDTITFTIPPIFMGSF